MRCTFAGEIIRWNNAAIMWQGIGQNRRTTVTGFEIDAGIDTHNLTVLIGLGLKSDLGSTGRRGAEAALAVAAEAVLAVAVGCWSASLNRGRVAVATAARQKWAGVRDRASVRGTLGGAGWRPQLHP